MDSSIVYASTAAHQTSSFGIDNILTGMNMTASTTPAQLHHNHYGGCDASSVPSMILRKIDSINENKRESLSSIEDDEDGMRKKKKPRTAFSREQVAELEKKFNEKKYLSSAERGELAEKLKLSDMQVKTWFQNRRMKYKRQTEEAEMELKPPKYPYGPFVPYTSIYGYMPYKTAEYNNGIGNGVYNSSLNSCSQQYSSTLNNPESFNGSGYSSPNIMSPVGTIPPQRYFSTQQHRGSLNGGTVFNRGGVSPLSSPSTPASANSYSTNSYFSEDFVASSQYTE